MMKKFMIFLLIGCLALLVSTSIFAANPPASFYKVNAGQLEESDAKDNANVGASTTLKAFVHPYASVSFGSQGAPLFFDGTALQEKSGSIDYTLETNCDVYVDGFGTAFAGVTHPTEKLKTWYSLEPADAVNGGTQTRIVTGDYVVMPEGYDHEYAPGYVGTYHVYYGASTGTQISSQRAGHYTATFVVTVWNPHNIN